MSIAIIIARLNSASCSSGCFAKINRGQCVNAPPQLLATSLMGVVLTVFLMNINRALSAAVKWLKNATYSEL